MPGSVTSVFSEAEDFETALREAHRRLSFIITPPENIATSENGNVSTEASERETQRATHTRAVVAKAFH